jgi:hypothetical protein
MLGLHACPLPDPAPFSLLLEVLKEKLTTYSMHSWGEGEERTVAKWDKYRVRDSFRLIASDEDFWRLYEQHLTNILDEYRMSGDGKGVGSLSSMPLLSRSGRPLAFESAEVDFDALWALLQKPLGVPTITELLTLLTQAYKLTGAGNPSTGIPQSNLEQLLDYQDSEAVTSVLTVGLVELFKANTAPELESLRTKWLQLSRTYIRKR